MQTKTPLDASQYVDDDIDVDDELEITKTTLKRETPSESAPKVEIPEGPNPKFERLSDYDLEIDIKKHRAYLRDLPLKDTRPLENKIEDLENEKLFREKRNEQEKLNQGARPAVQRNVDNGRPRSTRATPSFRSMKDLISETDCSGRLSKGHETIVPAFSEECCIVNPPKGKGPFTQLSPNTEGSAFNKGKDVSRISSGDLARPSPRPGLRSGSRFEEKQSKSPPISSRKESQKRNSSLGPAPGRKGNGASKRARQGVRGEDSLEKIVELMSSDDEEVIETKDTSADCQISSQRGSLSPSLDGARIAYPSRNDPEAVEVPHHDLQRLEPLEFLNDTLIDFYIKYIQRPEVLTAEDKTKFHFFNSFFYKKLSETVGGQNKKTVTDLSKLRKWTRGTNIFEKDYLFVPIHDKWHWSLAIVCHPGATSEDSGSQRCILHLDSLNPGHKSNNVFRLLRTYLIAEWEHQADEDKIGDSFQKLRSEDFVVKKIPVPQQENESDCGLFLLHYIELFVKEAPSSFQLSDVDQGGLFGLDWFKPKQAHGLRRDLKILLEKIFKQESSRAMKDAEKIESSSCQCHCHGSGSLLQNDTQPVICSAVGLKCCDSPGRSLVNELVHTQNTPATSVPNMEPSPGVSSPEALQVECAQQHSGNDDVLRIEKDISTCSQDNCGSPGKSNELPPPSEFGSSADFESFVWSKPLSGGSPDNTKKLKQLHQSTSREREMAGDDQLGLPLVFDIPIQEEQHPAG